MAVMEKLRDLFLRFGLPEDAREAFLRAPDAAAAMRSLDEARGRNEMEMQDLEKELASVEAAIAVEEGKVRAGSLPASVETSILRRIERLGKHRDNLESRLAILNENVNLLLALVAKVQEVEAMGLRGVDEDQIDNLLEESESTLGQYRRVMQAGQEGGRAVHAVDRSAEQKRHAELKQQILGAGPSREGKERRRTETE